MTQSTTSSGRPVTLVVAATLLALEAVIALVYAVIEIGQVRITRAGSGVGVTIMMACFGLLLLVVARGVFLGKGGVEDRPSRHS